jgi:hypothetical protein
MSARGSNSRSWRLTLSWRLSVCCECVCVWVWMCVSVCVSVMMCVWVWVCECECEHCWLTD